MKRILIAALLAGCFTLPAFAAPEDDLAAAVKLLRTGKAQEAIPTLTVLAADETAPRETRANAYYVLSVTEGGNTANALTYLNKALELHPQLERALVRKTEILFAQKDHKGAALAADSGLALAPGAEKLLRYRAASRMELGEYDAAAADYTTLVRRHNRDGAAYLQRGRAYQLSGKHDDALVDFDSAARYGSALSPKDLADLWYFRGLSYQQTAEFSNALDAYAKAASLKPDPARKDELAARRAETLKLKTKADSAAGLRKDLDIALRHIQLEDMKAATVILRTVLGNEFAPDEIKARACFLLSFTSKDNAWNLEQATKAAAMDPNASHLWRKGFLLFFSGNYAGSLEAMNAARERSPKSVAYIYWCGRARLELNRNEEALQDFDEVARLDAAWPPAYVYRAAANLRLNKPENAWPDVRKASGEEQKLSRDDAAELYYVAGRLHELDKEHDQALYSYDRSLAVNPSGPRGTDAAQRKKRIEEMRSLPQ